MEFAAEELQANRVLALAAVSRDGCALRFVAPELREDRDVVLVAITQDANAWHFAAAGPRADREVREAYWLQLRQRRPW